MENKEFLKNNYHEYMRIANELPQQMKDCGVFRYDVPIRGHDLEFSCEGFVEVDRNSELIPVNSLDSLLLACFRNSDLKVNGGYANKPLNLSQVDPEHMAILKNAISQVQDSLEAFQFYKK